MAPRSGFIIKNAPDVFGLVDEAEPDALDFNLLGNHRYGVLSGCLVQMGSGLNVAIGSGIVIVNGAILKVAAAQVTLADPGQSARFDLIYVNNAGSVGFIRGTASPNPVFPEYADDVTILASVFVQPGTSPTQLNITDKRVFLPERYRTALDAGTLLGSYQTASLTPRFEIDYSGQHRWGGGALLWESSPLTLSVHADLNVEGVIGANDLLVQHDITVGGNITSDNLQRGSGPPSGTANDGDLYQDTLNGGLWTMEDGIWQRLSTVPIPVGTVSAMMRDDEPMGWLKLNGQKTQESRAGGLWALHPEWIAGGLLQLPDYTACYLRQGPIGNKGGTPTITLREENLPPHKHLRTPSGTTQPAGSHSHNASIQAAGPHGHTTQAGGDHAHAINDPGHQHFGAWPGGYIIAQVWGGPWRLDGPFNDASHPTAVGAIPGVNTAFTGISVSGGGHSHVTDQQGGHNHVLTISPTGSDHVHDIHEDLVGGGVAFDNNPLYGCVNWFIKT